MGAWDDLDKNDIEIERVGERYETPESSEWECCLFGDSNGPAFIPKRGGEPNFFWRWMQFMCFGFRWRKRRA